MEAEVRDDLTIVVPAWNEADGIGLMLDAAASACRRLVEAGEVADWEIVVVDDGSTDATAERVVDASRGEPRVRLVRHDGNVGLGGALTTGLGAATGRLVIYVDADLPFDSDEIGTAVRLQRRSGAGLVAAYRRSRGGEGPRRAVYSVIYNALVRVVIGVRVRDVNFAGKLVTREVLESIDLRSRGSFIDAELVARVQRGGWAVEQFAVDYRPRSRGVSTLSSLGVIRTILVEMASLAPELRSIRERPGERAVRSPTR